MNDDASSSILDLFSSLFSNLRFECMAIVTFLVLVATSPGYADPVQRSAVFELDIHDVNIAQSLLDLAEKTKCDIVFSDNNETLKPAPALIGSYTLAEAVSILLANTALIYSIHGDQIRVKQPGVYILPRITVHSYLQKDFTGIQVDNEGLNALPRHILPLSIQTVSEDYFDRVESKDISDVLAYMSGVEYFESFFDAYPQFYSRGQKAPFGINGKLQRTAPMLLDQAVIERIDVLQGPSMNYITPGGMINFVLKKPTPINRFVLKASSGSYDFYRTEFDLNYAPKKSDKFSSRFIMSVEDQKGIKSFDYHSSETILSSIKVEGDRDDALTMQLYYRSEADYPDTLSLHRDMLGVDLPQNRTLGFPWADTQLADKFFSGDYSLLWGGAEFSLSVNWRDFEVKTWKNNMTNVLNIDGDVLPLLIVQEGKTNSYSIDSAIEYAYTLASTDFLTRVTVDYQNYLQSVPIFRKQPFEQIFNVFNPHYTISRPSKPERVGGYSVSGDVYGLSLSNNIYLSEWFTLYSELRYEILQFGGRNTDLNFGIDKKVDGGYEGVTTQLGINTQWNDTLSSHVSYTDLFSHQPVPDASKLNDILNSDTTADFVSPIEIQQWEFSLKKQWLEDRVDGNVTVYRLKRSNIQTFNIDDTFTPLNAKARDQKAFGVTFNVLGQVSKNLSLVANVNYNDSYITTESPQLLGVDFFSIPSEKNRRLRNTAKNTANLWLYFNRLPRALKNIEIGVGVQYIGDRYADNTNRYDLPAYTTVDTVFRYVGIDNIKFSLSIKNIYDRRYYASTLGEGSVPPVEEGDPRSVYFNVKWYLDY